MVYGEVCRNVIGWGTVEAANIQLQGSNAPTKVSARSAAPEDAAATFNVADLLELARSLWRAADAVDELAERRVGDSSLFEMSTGPLVQAAADRLSDEVASAGSVSAALRREARHWAEIWSDSMDRIDDAPVDLRP